MQIIRDDHYNQKYNQYFLKQEVGGIIVLYDRVIDLAETTPTWSEWEPRLNFEETRTITANGTYNFDNTIYTKTIVNVPSNETIG